jgi:signal transduction histidine kinase
MDSDSESEVLAQYETLRASDWVVGPSRLPESHVSDGHIACLDEEANTRQSFTTQYIAEELQDGAACAQVGFGTNGESPAARIDDTVEWDGELRTHAIDELDGITAGDLDELLSSFRSLAADDSLEAVVVEMAPVVRALAASDLLTYETKLNALSRETGVLFLNRYERERVPDGPISRVLQAYPYVFADGVLACNPAYVPPSDFDSEGETHRLDRQVELLTELAEMRQERDELSDHADRLRVFANSIAHDLRNPLQTAIGRAELLPDDHEQVPVIREALDRMDALVEDGLTMVHGTDLTDAESVAIGEVANQCWTLIDGPEAELTVTEEFLVDCDPSRFRQLLENLFRNAVEHAGPSIAIEVGPLEQIHAATRADDSSYIGFYVEDDGPGIPDAERDRVFELGYSGDDGTGYGLPIVERIVDAHGWTVHVSTGSDGGARFEITGVDATKAP